MGVAERTTAAQAYTRQPRARVTINWTDPYRDLSIQTDATDENRVDHPANVADLIETVPSKWWHLDGTTALSAGMHAAPGTDAESINYQMGWWGATACDGSGDFSTPYPSIEVSFSTRPVYGLKVVGDDAWGEYPVDFVVNVYDQYDIILHTAVVTGNAAVVWSADITASAALDAVRMTLTISKWSTALRVVKIAEFFDSVVRVYEGDDIVSIDILEESEVKDGSLPIGNISANECDLELQNLEDTYFPDNTASEINDLISVNRKVSVELGFVLADGSTEYAAMGTFWSGDWSTDELGDTAKTSCRDRMELLRKSTYVPGEVYEDYTLYDLLVAVLEDAKTTIKDLAYSVDVELDEAQYLIPYAVFERKSHFETIRRLCEVGMAFAFADRDDVVTIMGPTAATTEGTYYDITKDLYFGRSQPANTDEIANVIEVTTSPLVLADSLSTVYTSQNAISIAAGETKTVEVKYSFNNTVRGVVYAAAALIEGATASIDSVVYYSWGASVTISSASADTFKIQVGGWLLSVDGQETIIERDEDSIREYGEIRYEMKENILLQSRTLAEYIAPALLASYALPRKDAVVSWCGDMAVAVTSDFQAPTYQKNGINNTAVYKVTKNQISFDGSLRYKTTGRKLRDIVPADTWEAYQDTDDVATLWQDQDNADPDSIRQDTDET